MFPLRDVMELSNRHYYANHTVLGAKGDFITAPEMSQIFGEIVALWVLLACKKIECSTPTLVELGPGRGTLMMDMVRTLKKVAPSVFKNFQPHIIMVETSKALQTHQKQTLKDCPYPLHFFDYIPFQHSSLTLPTFFIANEFFDALPINQYTYKDNTWQEVFLSFNEHGGPLHQCIGKKATPCLQKTILPLSLGEDTLPEGSILEYSRERLDVASTLSNHIKAHGGGALIIDYGDYKAPPRIGNTLQSVKEHTYVNPFDYVGTADWTSHVDFYALHKIFEGDELICHMETQKSFLNRHGFDTRLEALLKNCPKEIYNDTLYGANRLVDPKEMGELFKVLSVTKTLSCPI